MQDISRQIGIAIRWLPLMIVVALLAGAVAYTWSSGQPDVYQATARLRVDPGPEASLQDMMVTEAAVEQYADLATSAPVLQAVIERLELDTSPTNLSRRIETEVDSLWLDIRTRAGDANDARVLALALGNEMRKRVRDSLFTSQVKAADDAIAANRRTIRTLQTRLDTLRRKPNKDFADRTEIINLAGQISNLQTASQGLQSNSSAFVRNRLQWSERPTSPPSPIEPRPLYWTLLALVAGGMLAAALAYFAEYLRTRDRIRDEVDLEAATGLLPVGTVTEARRDRKAGAPARLVMLRYPHSAAAEAYRGLLSRVGFASGGARTLMVAGVGDPESKSVVAANLALAYAEAGRNVILVDADHRVPRLHHFFGLRNDRGLTTVLGDPDVPLGWVTVATSHPRLGLMPAGPPRRESFDPLGATQLNALVRRLLHSADMVIFDSPSMAGSLDAAVLAANLQESLLVVEAGDSEERTAEAARILHASDAELVGAVLFRRVRSHPGRGSPVVPPPVAVAPKAPALLPSRIPVPVAGAATVPHQQPARPTAGGPQPTGRPPAPPPTAGNGAAPAAGNGVAGPYARPPSPPRGPYAAPFTATAAPHDRPSDR